ncbi:MAG: hypothetical protein ABI868_26380 [Acidobacteriota bacterium]
MATSTALAQDRERPSLIGSIARQVALDPSTYAPAIIAFDGTMRDWKTSQPLFENGFMEHNSRFTISGRANDLPVPYADGRRRILIDAATTFGVSALNNFTTRVIERKLTERYPEHRTLVRAASWVERISFGVYLSYVLSKDHYRQAGLNTAQAQQLGYR